MSSEKGYEYKRGVGEGYALAVITTRQQSKQARREKRATRTLSQRRWRIQSRMLGPKREHPILDTQCKGMYRGRSH
jgi:hypothetical protein